MENKVVVENDTQQKNLITFRKSLGLAHSPQAYLESEHQKREAKIHELNKTLLGERESITDGIIADRLRQEAEKKDRCKHFLEMSNTIDQVKRASAIVAMKVKGVKDPTQFVQILETTGSDLIFEFDHSSESLSPWQHSYNLPVPKSVSHKDLQSYVGKDFVLAKIDRGLLKTGLERMQLLGYKIDFSQTGLYREDSGFVQYFTRIAQISETEFNKNIQTLNLKGVNLDKRVLGYEEYPDNEYQFKLNYGAEDLLISLETGEIPEELKSKLEAINEISELTDDLVKIPFRCLEFYSTEDLQSFSTLIEHELASNGSRYESPSMFYTELNKDIQKAMIQFGGKNIYPSFAKALQKTDSYWFVFQNAHSSYSATNWMTDGFSNGLHERPDSLQDRADKLNQLMSDLENPFLAPLLQYYKENGISVTKEGNDTWFGALEKRVDFINQIMTRVDKLSDNERIQTFSKLSLAYFTIFDDGLDLKINLLLGSNSEELSVLKQSVAGQLCIRNGEIDPSLIASAPNKARLPYKMLEEHIKTQPELYDKYIQLLKESESTEWVDMIPDPNLFWKENAGWLVTMHSKGLNPENLQIFRRLNGNANIREILQDQALTKDLLLNLQSQIGLNEQNITYLDKDTLIFVKEKIENEATRTKFFRGLLSMHPREFSGTINCLREATNIVDIDSPETQKLINQAINEIGAITPIVLREYVNEVDVVKRSRFVEGVKTARIQLLTSQPIRQIFADRENGDELLAELITLSFPGNELSTVKMELQMLLDRNSDLEGVNSNPNGYESRSEAKTKYAFLKVDESIDRELLDYLKQLIPNPNTISKNPTDFNSQFDKAIVKLIKGAGSYQLADLKNELPIMFSVLAREPEVRDIRKAIVDQSQVNTVTQFLGRVSEVVGVYFKDNFSSRLEEHFKDSPEIKRHLDELLTDQRLTQIEKNLIKIPEQDLAVLKPAIQRLKDALNQHTQSSEKDVATVISTIVGNRVLGGKGGLRSLVKKEIGKFGFKKAEGNVVEVEDKPFRGVVSKNVASYFAKRTAGLCTAADTELFNRPDHFHINLIRENMVIGNIQGYMIDYNGKRSFLFRGLNPSSSVVNHGNAEFYCEGMINIIKQFAKDNEIEEVFLAEQLGGWHALTNRVGEGVIDYIAPKYLTKENEVDFTYSITKTQNISKMYKLSSN